MMKPSAKRFGQFYEDKEALSCVRTISMTSCTIPGQARDLGALLASAKYQGGMIPRHGTPVYDEDLAHGMARMQLEQLDDEQLSQIAIEAAGKADKKEEPANDDAAAAPAEGDGD